MFSKRPIVVYFFLGKAWQLQTFFLMSCVRNALGAGGSYVKPLELAPVQDLLEGTPDGVAPDLQALVVLREANFQDWFSCLKRGFIC